jgi:hypothetical protein
VIHQQSHKKSTLYDFENGMKLWIAQERFLFGILKQYMGCHFDVSIQAFEGNLLRASIERLQRKRQKAFMS